MISLFRKIRQKLVSQNRLTRYLVYAIGEILLVVFGILIALQVNNWNQDRLERRKSKEYHERLKSELDQIIDFLVEIEDYSTQVAVKLDQSVAILESGTFNDSTKQIFDFALDRYFQLSRHLPELTSYEEMKSSGQLGLIYSLEIREKLGDFLTQQKLVTTIYEGLNEKVNQMSFLDAYVKFEPDANTGQNSFDYDFREIQKDQTVINTLSRYAFHWKTKSLYSKSLKNQSIELRDLIQYKTESFK